MEALLIVVAYVAVWLVYGWRLTVFLLDARVRYMLREFQSDRRKGAAAVAAGERGEYVVIGFGLALFWPVVLPVRAAYRVLAAASAGQAFRTPAEQEEQDHQELESLRKQAKDYGLPMPDGPR
jgi:hypothetical protein